MISLQRRCKKHHLNQVFSIRELTFEKIYPEVLFYVTLVRVFMFFGVLPDSNIRKLYYGRLASSPIIIQQRQGRPLVYPAAYLLK